MFGKNLVLAMQVFHRNPSPRQSVPAFDNPGVDPTITVGGSSQFVAIDASTGVGIVMG
jgi:hypothetical protein